MKRFFIKMLPVMAAMLLATSCGKDDNDSNVVIDDNAVVDNSQPIETVANGITTITVTGKVSKASLSKVTVANNSDRTLQFEGGEKFVFGKENEGSGWGTVEIADKDGKYTATLNFPTGKETEFLAGSYTATLNEENSTLPADELAVYDDLASAVQNAYYTIDFTVQTNDGGNPYKLTSEGSSDIVVSIQSAFISASVSGWITVRGESFYVKKDKYYIVPNAMRMGSGSNSTAKGKIYAVNKAADVPAGYVDLGIVVDGKHVYFAEANHSSAVWASSSDRYNCPSQAEWVALWESCYWQFDSETEGVYVFKPSDPQDKGLDNVSGHEYSEQSGDAFISLPANQMSYTEGCYWANDPTTTYACYRLYFKKSWHDDEFPNGLVDPRSSISSEFQCALRYVKRVAVEE